MIRGKAVVVGIFLGLAAAGGVFYWYSGLEFPALPPHTLMKIKVPSGATFGDITSWIGAAGETGNILEAATGKYDLRKIVSGRELALSYDTLGGALQKLVYQIDSDDQLTVKRSDAGWVAEVAAIPYEVKEKESSGFITSSLYEAITSAGSDQRLALLLAEMFAWQVDFVADTRTGDNFKAVYEERYLGNDYVMPGKILAAQYVNDGEAYRGFYFPGSEKTRAGYYDESGVALQKVFLKAPLQYRYISSGFTYARVNPLTNRVSPHRGIDYASPAGTPAVSVGDGTVVQAGWNGPYGISVLIRHNNTYSSRYGHFSRLAKSVRVGAKVKQGQIVGYVGSTGLSTGSHLHYEMHKYGSYVNPFRVEVPPGDPVAAEDREAFSKITSLYSQRL